MFNSLYSKLAMVLLGLFCLIGTVFIGVALFSTNMYQQEVNQKLNRGLARSIVAENLPIKNSRISNKALQEIFHMLMVINPAIEVYLLNPEGEILAFSAEPGKVKRQRVDLKPIEKWLDGEATIPLLGDDPRDPDGRKVFSAARIPEKGELEGYLYVILSGEDYDSAAQKIRGSYIFRLSSWIIGASLIFALLAGLLLFALLTGRLKRLAAAMDAFKESKTLLELDLPLPQKQSHRGDEIDRLTRTFAQMARRLEEQMKELKKSDALRRELIANVSHDLRTPLANLQGYIETLLMKDENLEPGERHDYLEIAIKHCERLSALVADLFELARLDSRETKAHCEPFSLGELVQDVAQKFQLTAKEKKISLNTNFDQGLPFVYADIGLIERVLENLIENALRHTPEGGSTCIALIPESDSVSVEVRDTGAGIPPEVLPHIFERFYQFDDHANSEIGFSGLGLAIAKSILKLHNSTITVESVVHSGTSFSFKLPVHTG